MHVCHESKDHDTGIFTVMRDVLLTVHHGGNAAPPAGEHRALRTRVPR